MSTSDNGNVAHAIDRLRRVDQIKLPQRIHDFANAGGAAFTDECIEPYELVGIARFEELPAARQAHVRSCTLCSLVVGGENGASPQVMPSRDGVKAAAAAARQSLHEPLWWKLIKPVLIVAGVLRRLVHHPSEASPCPPAVESYDRGERRVDAAL